MSYKSDLKKISKLIEKTKQDHKIVFYDYELPFKVQRLDLLKSKGLIKIEYRQKDKDLDCTAFKVSLTDKGKTYKQDLKEATRKKRNAGIISFILAVITSVAASLILQLLH
ncbi:hypothetical protein ACKP2L_04940 [Oenococcus alcoholitolerans]|uniref:hypothetical protein n=1 Tax=Oenococcus alcoholitolerans TaxID=931074 RepID=UPI003F73036D